MGLSPSRLLKVIEYKIFIDRRVENSILAGIDKIALIYVAKAFFIYFYIYYMLSLAIINN